MIIDSIQNSSRYPFGPLWKKAFEFVQTLSPDMETRKYVLQDRDLYAGIDSYLTKTRSAAKLETHRIYVDIQVLISGSEIFEVFPKEGLTVNEPYNPEKDAEFYQIPPEPRAQITLKPGQFIVFFPEDAHMPCLMTGSTPQPVKKTVIKLAVTGIEPLAG